MLCHSSRQLSDRGHHRTDSARDTSIKDRKWFPTGFEVHGSHTIPSQAKTTIANDGGVLHVVGFLWSLVLWLVFLPFHRANERWKWNWKSAHILVRRNFIRCCRIWFGLRFGEKAPNWNFLFCCLSVAFIIYEFMQNLITSKKSLCFWFCLCPMSIIHCPWRLTKSMAMSSIRMLHWHLYYVLKYILIYFLGTFPCRCVGASFVDSYFIFCWPPIFVVTIWMNWNIILVPGSYTRSEVIVSRYWLSGTDGNTSYLWD